MSERKNNSPERTDDREIVITRVFDAPRELVFDAWTNPTHLTQWWGPRGFTTTTHEMQVKVGGVWRFIMHGPDGTDYPNKITYREVVRPERLVYAHVGESDDEPGSFVTTTTFEEQSGKTKVTMRAVFRTAAERDDVIKKHRALEGGNQTLDRLGEHLANLGAATKPFVISREFNASRELVFKVWTDRDHLMRWWGPKEVTMVSCRNDLRPGGAMHYCMRMPDGQDMWGKWVYRDILPPQRLVVVDSFSDPDANVTHHPMAATWPLELLTTVTFTEREGRTTVMVQWVPINATETERKAFERGHDSMREGWTGTLDRLGEYLAGVAAAR